jgi:chromosome segregation ATPase
MIIWGRKEEELFRKELELRKTQALAEIHNNIASLYATATRQTHEMEHDYHQAKEEVAKLEAKKEALELYLANILTEKDETIATLNKTIESLSRPQPIVK